MGKVEIILIDGYGRDIDYMRISITDRCNLRCRYCMPSGIKLCSHNDILTFDEIELVCKQAVKLGIVNFKITGGEPLIRRDCSNLIRKIYKIDGVKSVTLTSNGILLSKYIDDLIHAGVKNINISLDTMDRDRYIQITGFDELDTVLDAIHMAIDKGIKVKINSVLHDDNYEKDFYSLLELARKYPVDVRFIEMMPIGLGAKSRLVSNEELIKMLKSSFDNIREDHKKHGNGPAKYYEIDGFVGGVGFISAIHGKFCESCNRIRMTSTGDIKPCLCFDKKISVKEALKKKDEAMLEYILSKVIIEKPHMHCFEDRESITEMKNMTQIGG